jgi:hypothetical protein
MEIKYDISKYTQKQAYEKIDNFLDSLVIQHSEMISDPVKNWNDEKDKMEFRFKVKGFNIEGIINILDDKLVLNGKLPFVARLYSEKIESIIKEQLEELFL